MINLSARVIISIMIDTKLIDMNDMVTFMKAVGDEYRLGILRMLRDGELCACEIHGPLGIPQNLASHHLRILRECEAVKTRKDGKKVIYSLNHRKLKMMTDGFKQLTTETKSKRRQMMEIKVLGAGCRNCETLIENAKAAAVELGIEAGVVKVTDYGEILGFGIMATPGLVIDGKVVSSGKVPSKEDIKKFMRGVN